MLEETNIESSWGSKDITESEQEDEENIELTTVNF
jgi:hypothetical protein